MDNRRSDSIDSNNKSQVFTKYKLVDREELLVVLTLLLQTYDIDQDKIDLALSWIDMYLVSGSLENFIKNVNRDNLESLNYLKKTIKSNKRLSKSVFKRMKDIIWELEN